MDVLGLPGKNWNWKNNINTFTKLLSNVRKKDEENLDQLVELGILRKYNGR